MKTNLIVIAILSAVSIYLGFSYANARNEAELLHQKEARAFAVIDSLNTVETGLRLVADRRQAQISEDSALVVRLRAVRKTLLERVRYTEAALDAAVDPFTGADEELQIAMYDAWALRTGLTDVGLTNIMLGRRVAEDYYGIAMVVVPRLRVVLREYRVLAGADSVTIAAQAVLSDSLTAQVVTFKMLYGAESEQTEQYKTLHEDMTAAYKREKRKKYFTAAAVGAVVVAVFLVK